MQNFQPILCLFYPFLFAPDSKTLATGTRDTIRIWDIREAADEETAEITSTSEDYLSSQKDLKGHAGSVIGLDFNKENRLLASASKDKSVKVWDLKTGWDTLALKGHSGPVLSVSFTADDTKILTASLDSTIKIWDAASGGELSTVNIHEAAIYIPSVAVRIGSTVASGGKDKTIKIWDVHSKAENFLLKGHKSTVMSVCFSPDGKSLVSGSKDGEIKLWDMATGQELLSLQGHTGAVFDVKFSPDGQTIGSASKDSTIRLWNIQNSEIPSLLEGHLETVYCVSFSPDGNTLASSSRDGTVKLWDLQTETEITTKKIDSKSVYKVAFGTSGEYLAAAASNGSITLWEISRGPKFDYVSYLSGIELRNFSLHWKQDSSPSSYLNLSKDSHLSILQSGLPEEEIVEKLFYAYSKSNNWQSTLALFAQLPESKKGEAKEALSANLNLENHLAMDRSQMGVGHLYMQQLLEIGGIDEKDLELQYLDIKDKYMEKSLTLKTKQGPSSEQKNVANLMANLNRLLDSGLDKSAIQLADDFGAEIFAWIPSKGQEYTMISALDWLTNAQAISKSDPLKALQYCSRALLKDEEFVNSYVAPADSPWMEYALACAYGFRAGQTLSTSENSNKRDFNIVQAIGRLKLAKEKGWEDWNRLSLDRNFDSIRSDPQYQDFIAGQ